MLDPAAIPPGFDKNPTRYAKRAQLAALAAIGLLDALYLTLYQWGAWPVWDPFFDSARVLDLTHPVPDALAGVLAYGAELLLLALGGADRWRRLPWTCLALGAVLCTGAVVSVALIVLQPALAGTFCTLCLLSAAIKTISPHTAVRPSVRSASTMMWRDSVWSVTFRPGCRRRNESVDFRTT